MNAKLMLKGIFRVSSGLLPAGARSNRQQVLLGGEIRYRNAKLLAFFDEIVHSIDDGFRTKQTLYTRIGTWELVPLLRRGTKIDHEEVQKLESAYERSKLYFFIPNKIKN